MRLPLLYYAPLLLWIILRMRFFRVMFDFANFRNDAKACIKWAFKMKALAWETSNLDKEIKP